MPTPPKDLRAFESLLTIVEELRGPDGCPWDKEQTHQTLTRYAIEEAHEFAEAAERGTSEQVKGELGDMLLQVVLNAEIARQSGHFTIYDVIEGIAQKMVRRHPHVFADTTVNSTTEVVQNWHEIKAREQGAKKTSNRPLSFDIPISMPALLRSQKIGEKTRQHRFDWNQVSEVVAKVDEEIAELKEAIAQKTKVEQVAELGDVLFSVAQLARHLKADAEQTLREANARFEKRFHRMMQLVTQDKKQPESLLPAELEAYWHKAKRELA